MLQKEKSKKQYHVTNEMFEMDRKQPKTTTPKEDTEDIDDPCSCCFRRGWNETTRSETLGTLALWLQDFPMLLLAFLYTFSQTTCKTPDPRDTTPALLDIGISASAAVAASLWRLLRTLYRSYITRATRLTPNKTCCGKNCLPQRSKVLYPPDTCAGYCYAPCCGCLPLKALVIIAFGVLTGVVWYDYVKLTNERNFDDSLGIYRFSVNSEKDPLLFTISGNIIPPNGTFVNLEKIPAIELEGNYDVFCLSEFEYRPEDFQIYFNALELVVVSQNGQFCATIETDLDGSDPNFCTAFYTLENFVLYYASLDPVTGKIRRFDEECSVVKDRLGFATPKVDPNIDVTQHLKSAGFSQNGEPLVIYYSDLDIHYLVSDVLASTDRVLHSIIPNVADSQGTTLSCAADFWYIEINGQIRYNYRDVFNLGLSGCQCSISTDICEALHRNVVYGYLHSDQITVTEYTNCSTLPADKIVPYYWPSASVRCPC